MTRLALMISVLSILFGCANTELVPFADSQADDQPPPTQADLYAGMDSDTVEKLEEFQGSISAWKCGPYLEKNLQELMLTKGKIDGLEIGGVFLGDLEIVAAFSIEGLDMRWDWEDYAIVLSPNNLARYYDFTMAERDEDTGQRQTSSSLTWTCKKEK